MDLDYKSIKALFRGKINLKSTRKRMNSNNLVRLPLCYTVENKGSCNYSFSKKNKMQNFIRNKEISLCSNNYVSNTNDTFNRKNSLSKEKVNENRIKNNKINEDELNRIKHNYILTQNISNISVNRSYMNQLNQNRQFKNEIKNMKNNSITNNNIQTNLTYLAKTPNNINVIRKINKSKSNFINKSKIILVKKNKKFLDSQLSNKKEVLNYSTLTELKHKKHFSYSNTINNYSDFKKYSNKFDYIRNMQENNINNKIIYNLPYKRKIIFNKPYSNLRLNILNENQNRSTNKFHFSNKFKTIETSNILAKSQGNLLTKNPTEYKIDEYMNKSNNRHYSVEKKKSNIDIGIGTNHYNVKNLNINFNNIKVVNNNVSKKNLCLEKNKKNKFIDNNKDIDIIKKNEEISFKKNLNTINILTNSTIERNILRPKIKVSKIKSSLKFSDDLMKSANNINIMKKKILNGKSEMDIKNNKKKIRIMKIDSCTIEGKSFKQKYNQENFFMKEKFLNKNEQFLIGICNGHGKHGKLISKYIINTLPELIHDISENEIINSYLQMNKQILKNNNKAFDCSLSGSSCISLIISLENIISANLGDNKAILARYENGLYNYVNLNREHKPTMPDEKKRILEHNGKIGHIYEKSNSPKKVYLKNSDIPGLPLSRSFGDVIAHSVGVISEPEVKNFSYNGSEKFVIMASHGFWSLINGEKSVEIVKEFYDNNMDAIGALNKLALELLNKSENEKKIINEDIIIIIVFFE